MNVSQSGEFFAQPVAVKFLSKKVIKTLFRPGRHLRGMVTRDLGEGKFVFRVAKYNLVATSVKPLLVGQPVKVLVKENKPKLVLQFQPEDAEEISIEKPAKEKTPQQEKNGSPGLFFHLADGEIIDEVRIFDNGHPRPREAGDAFAFVLGLTSAETGSSTYEFHQTEETLSLDISTEKFAWFQSLRSNLPELQQLLVRQTGKRVLINVRLQQNGRADIPNKKSGTVNLKI